MRKLKQIGSMIVLSILCTFLLGMTNRPTEQFYINDYAGVIGEEAEHFIYETAKALYDASGAQIVVLTMDTTGDETIDDYSLRTARAWGIGSKDENNGVLILLAVEDRNVFVQVGYGLEGCLTDSKIGRILDEYAVPYYGENDFEMGTLVLFERIINAVSEEYGLEIISEGIISEEEEVSWIWTLLGIVLLLIGGTVCMWGVTVLWELCKLVFFAILDLKTKGHRARDYWPTMIWNMKAWRLFTAKPGDADYEHWQRVSDRLGDGKDGSSNSGGGGSFGGGGAGRGF